MVKSVLSMMRHEMKPSPKHTALFFLLLILAACGGPTPPDAPTMVLATPQPTDATSGDTAESGVLLALGAPEFAVEVSGDVELIMPPGSAIYGGLAAVESVPPRRQLLFFHSDLNGMRQITIEFPPQTQPGTYTFNGGVYGVNRGTMVASFTAFTIGDDPEANVSYAFDRQVSGTLTLTAVEGFASGSFRFTATDSAAEKTVTVAGEFSNIAYVGG